MTEITINGAEATIHLPCGRLALIDSAYVELVRGRAWFSSVRERTVYVFAWSDGEGSARVNLHRLIMDEPDGKTVDHKDCDGLNNRRANLRVATNTQNCRNSRLQQRPDKLSRFKGVRPIKRVWAAKIVVNGTPIELGRFKGEDEAARAYDAAAKRYFGEFARTNEDEGLFDKATTVSDLKRRAYRI